MKHHQEKEMARYQEQEQQKVEAYQELIHKLAMNRNKLAPDNNGTGKVD